MQSSNSKSFHPEITLEEKLICYLWTAHELAWNLLCHFEFDVTLWWLFSGTLEIYWFQWFLIWDLLTIQKKLWSSHYLRDQQIAYDSVVVVDYFQRSILPRNLELHEIDWKHDWICAVSWFCFWCRFSRYVLHPLEIWPRTCGDFPLRSYPSFSGVSALMVSDLVILCFVLCLTSRIQLRYISGTSRRKMTFCFYL